VLHVHLATTILSYLPLMFINMRLLLSAYLLVIGDR